MEAKTPLEVGSVLCNQPHGVRVLRCCLEHRACQKTDAGGESCSSQGFPLALSSTNRILPTFIAGLLKRLCLLAGCWQRGPEHGAERVSVKCVL